MKYNIIKCFIVQFKYRTKIFLYRIGNSESMITISSSTPEYIIEDLQANRSSVSLKVSSPRLENIDIHNTTIKITEDNKCTINFCKSSFWLFFTRINK